MTAPSPAPAPSSRPLTSRDLHGVYVALVTPFDETGAIDEPSFVALTKWLLLQRIDGFVLNGTTGESPTVRWPEVLRLLARLREVVGGRVPIVVGTGTYDTAESIERTESAARAGADAALAVVPYYSRPSPAGVIEHIRAIANVGLPTLVYNIPYRTGLTLDLKTLVALMGLPGVIGIKESSGGLANVAPLAATGTAVLTGEDALFLPGLTVGAQGGILAAANLLGGAYARISRAVREQRLAEACREWARIRPIVDALFAESNPSPLKWALEKTGRIGNGRLRLPLLPCSPTLQAQLASLLAEAGEA